MLWKSDWLRNFSMKAFRLVLICRYIDSKREFPFWPEAILRFYTSNFHEASHIAAPTRKIILNRLLSWFEMTFRAPSESVLAILLEHMVEQFCICRFTRQVRATSIYFHCSRKRFQNELMSIFGCSTLTLSPKLSRSCQLTSLEIY